MHLGGAVQHRSRAQDSSDSMLPVDWPGAGACQRAARPSGGARTTSPSLARLDATCLPATLHVTRASIPSGRTPASRRQRRPKKRPPTWRPFCPSRVHREPGAVTNSGRILPLFPPPSRRRQRGAPGEQSAPSVATPKSAPPLASLVEGRRGSRKWPSWPPSLQTPPPRQAGVSRPTMENPNKFGGVTTVVIPCAPTLTIAVTVAPPPALRFSFTVASRSQKRLSLCFGARLAHRRVRGQQPWRPPPRLPARPAPPKASRP